MGARKSLHVQDNTAPPRSQPEDARLRGAETARLRGAGYGQVARAPVSVTAAAGGPW